MHLQHVGLEAHASKVFDRNHPIRSNSVRGVMAYSIPSRSAEVRVRFPPSARVLISTKHRYEGYAYWSCALRCSFDLRSIHLPRMTHQILKLQIPYRKQVFGSNDVRIVGECGVSTKPRAMIMAAHPRTQNRNVSTASESELLVVKDLNSGLFGNGVLLLFTIILEGRKRF